MTAKTARELADSWDVDIRTIHNYIRLERLPIVRSNPIMIDEKLAIAWAKEKVEKAPGYNKTLKQIVNNYYLRG